MIEIFFNADPALQIGVIITIIVVIFISSVYLQKLGNFISSKFLRSDGNSFYREVIQPDLGLVTLLWFLGLLDIYILVNEKSKLIQVGEILLSLGISFLTIFLVTRWFRLLFDKYLLNAALKSDKKINSEFLIVGKFLANAIIVLLIIFIFSQVHKINLFGLLASLGIGGLAIAFAAQKTLEQVLGGIVIYLDRPFSIDDYIGLPDGVFGRVESIGLRSTKIRLSGKGTLMIIPNSSLTQVNIENYTGAKKIISLVYFTFNTSLDEDEMALIRQIIIDSTKDIFGIDPKNTGVKFEDINQGKNKYYTQAQVSFFLLGSERVSMDLRRQLLDIAKENITLQLKNYGINFTIEDETINVDSPITI
ncbi:mechanosensitive ion channel [Cyanobacterium stanieri LEGE 03274]|uniref:Mechanosensitive ion channel n=1 Tax=Cyanobacterium stanieri LEGE 03274 TaxID=1828756 RepID=A0ABR9V2R9_9CHRO|nr:mechanosensitive ion channel domain-containing protein [Cyanobacterium stanieri]MBE9221119.1 mechanosensitive ion channel [Cyanobacterium stanieri LEGE 03274]